MYKQLKIVELNSEIYFVEENPKLINEIYYIEYNIKNYTNTTFISLIKMSNITDDDGYYSAHEVEDDFNFTYSFKRSIFEIIVATTNYSLKLLMNIPFEFVKSYHSSKIKPKYVLVEIDKNYKLKVDKNNNVIIK